MFNYLRLSYNLLRLANSVLDKRKERFKKELEGLDLSERVLEDTLDCLIVIKDHLVRKMCIHWLKKKSIILPEDLPKVETAKDLAKRNRGIDYLKFDSPVEIIDKFEEKAQIEFDRLLKPDSLPELYNKVDLGDGVTIYTVEDTKDGQYAVRRLADSHFGPGFDKWCITGRYPDLFPDKERDEMGMILESFDYWKNRYNKYPKRLAFKNGKLFAFCGSDEKEIVWWDQGDSPFDYIPKHTHLDDDQNFIDKYIHEIGDHFETDIKKMGSLDVKRALLSDTVSDDFKLQIIDTAGGKTRRDIAENPKTPVEILVKLSSDTNNYIRSCVAQNPSTPVEALIKLSSDVNGGVRCSVAKNPNTPEDVLVKLSKDEHWSVRYYVAKNPNAPVDALVKLSSDEDEYVRCCVAQNPNTPANVLVKLSNDKDSYVRRSVAYSPKLPKEDLIKLSRDKEWDVRANLALNLKATEDILRRLSKDREYFVRQSVAANPKASVELLVKLSKDSAETVRNRAIESLRKRGVDV